MWDSLFLQGLVIGFAIAMPVGPIGMICIHHALLRGMKYGLMAGLGAALADTLYGALAGFGITIVSNFLSNYQFIFQILGSIFLCYLGARILLSKPLKETGPDCPITLSRIFTTTFLLTLTNPMTILSFAGIFAGLGISVKEDGIYSALILTTGVFVGSSVWWLILSYAASLFGKNVDETKTYWLNKISGGVILTCGCFASIFTLQQFIVWIS